jgi:hypothetical protein
MTKPTAERNDGGTESLLPDANSPTVDTVRETSKHLPDHQSGQIE